MHCTLCSYQKMPNIAATTFAFRVSFGDVDGDGAVDAYVTVQGAPNELYISDGTGHFSEEGAARGVASPFDGRPALPVGVSVHAGSKLTLVRAPPATRRRCGRLPAKRRTTHPGTGGASTSKAASTRTACGP